MNTAPPHGNYVVGRLHLKADPNGNLVIARDGIDREGKPVTWYSQIEYRGFDPRTGEASRFKTSLDAVNEGQVVMVQVLPKVRPGGTTSAGKAYGAFVVYSALDVLPAVTANQKPDLKPVASASA